MGLNFLNFLAFQFLVRHMQSPFLEPNLMKMSVPKKASPQIVLRLYPNLPFKITRAKTKIIFASILHSVIVGQSRQLNVAKLLTRITVVDS